MNMMRNLLAVAGIAAAVGLGGAANAQNVFTVSPTGVGEPNANFNADTFGSTATSRVLLNNVTGTFSEFGYIQVTSFNLGGPIVVGTGLNNDYGLYAVFQGSGSFSVSGGTTINGSFSSLSLSLYLDPLLNTGLGAYSASLAAGGSNPVNNTGLITNVGDDILLGTGVLPNLSGEASASALINLLSTVSGGAATGSFGGTLGFSLTAQGSNFFVNPVPFYNLLLAQQTPINGGIQYLSGPTFGTSTDAELFLSTGGPGRFLVPEPATLAIFGMGLIGLAGILRRRREQV